MKASVNKDNVIENVLDYFIHNQSGLLTRLQEDKANENVKKEMLKLAEEQFLLFGVEKKDLAAQVENFERYIWGYYKLDDLINDKEISDIKCYSADRIRVKRKGHREATDVKFESENDYRRFINMVAVKNQINISQLNAIQNFTDEKSCPDFTLRCDICTEYINVPAKAMLQIRKFPKYKYTMEELTKQGMLTKEQAEYLKKKAVESRGILFTGSGSAGKSTLLNCMIELIPQDQSGLVIQENPEIFADKHPDILVQRIRRNSGENRVQYTLDDLTRNALMIDVDYIIIGEIKGHEAAAFSKASYTGYKCWATVHGLSEMEAIYKLADYIKQATSYEFSECLRMLTGIETVVFLKKYKVAGIAEIKGYDNEKKDLIIEKVEFPATTQAQEGGYE